MTDGDLATVFDEWATWERSRRLYAPSPNVQSIMGAMVGPTGRDRPDAANDALMPHIHSALLSNPPELKLIVAAHYKRKQQVVKEDGTVMYRRDPMKRLAGNLGMSQRTLERHLPIARRKVYEVAKRLHEDMHNPAKIWREIVGGLSDD
jgi:hypothetical protein